MTMLKNQVLENNSFSGLEQNQHCSGAYLETVKRLRWSV